jgi:tyrosine-protein phosphatase SIW14
MRRLLLVSLLTWRGFAADAPAPTPVGHVRNFGVVNAHLFRGGDPGAVGLAELGAAGVKVDIDLREKSAATEAEKLEAEKLGMKYLSMPLPELSAPPAIAMRSILSLLTQEQAQGVFIHCRRGKDRTGTVIACYRMQHDGWDRERALAEAKHYGMSFAERGMRSFILHFQPSREIAGAMLTSH